MCPEPLHPLIVIIPLLTAPFPTAAFYCAYLLVLIITAFVRSNVFFVFLDAVRPAPVLSFIARTASETDGAPFSCHQ